MHSWCKVEGEGDPKVMEAAVSFVSNIQGDPAGVPRHHH